MVQRTLWGHTVDIEIPDGIFPSEERQKELDEIFNHPERGYFEGTYEGKKLFYRKHLPKDGAKPKGIIVYHHGIHGQSGFGMQCKDGRYTDFALRCRMYTEEGFAVYAHDMLGHGYSEGKRFLIPQSGNWKINRDDYVKFVNTVVMKEQSDDIPLFLVGDSYGGCLVVHAARWFQDHPDETPKNFHGIHINCPAVMGDLPSAPVVAVLRRLAVLTPTWTPFFMPHPVSPDRIWKEDEVRDYEMNKKDGLSLGGVPFQLGTALGLLQSLEHVQAETIPGFKVPFSINHGTHDHGVPISGSEFLMEHSDTPKEDKVLNKIEGGYHNLYCGLEAKEHVQMELKWMREQIAKQAK